MAEKILIASGKGGVGKSTLASFMGQELARKENKVLLIDTDVGLSALDILLGLTEQVVYNWLDVLQKRCKPSEALIKADEKGFLNLLPAPLIFTNYLVLPSEMKLLIMEYDSEYDYIIIDAPAGLGQGLVMSSSSADLLIVVATPDEPSVRGAYAVAELLEEKGVPQSRLVINRFRKKEVRQGGLLGYDSMIDRTCVRLLGIVPESNPPLSTLGKRVPSRSQNRTLQAFSRIIRRIEGEDVPLGIL